MNFHQNPHCHFDFAHSECVAPRLETFGMTPWPAKSNHVPVLPSLITFLLYSTVPVSVAMAYLDDDNDWLS
jgi:hypothetical protein